MATPAAASHPKMKQALQLPHPKYICQASELSIMKVRTILFTIFSSPNQKP
jgi:hypothetical protein